MKKLFPFLCVSMAASVLCCGSTFAQTFPTDKGSCLIYGGFTFSSAGGDLYESSGNRVTTTQLNPSVGYFLTPGLALGGRFIYSRTSQGSASVTTWGIGPSILFFIDGDQSNANIKGESYPYVGLNFLYVSGSSKIGTHEYTVSGTMISFGVGLCHMLSNTVGITTEFGYQMDNMNPENGNSENGNKFNIIAGIVAFLY
jgi:hypothetical protein